MGLFSSKSKRDQIGEVIDRQNIKAIADENAESREHSRRNPKAAAAFRKSADDAFDDYRHGWGLR